MNEDITGWFVLKVFLLGMWAFGSLIASALAFTHAACMTCSETVSAPGWGWGLLLSSGWAMWQLWKDPRLR